MKATREALTRLIQWSLTPGRTDENSLGAARKAFPMFSRDQIRAIFAMTPGKRKRLLAVRISDSHDVKDYRNPEQAQKSAEIATDPSNR